METRANYAVIGAFVIVATMAIAGFVLWLGQSQFRQDFKAYDIVFAGPVSLEQGSDVRYIGIKVGEVSWVRIDRGDPSKVRARIRIDRETPVKTDSNASIQLAGITGITFVQISAGSPTAKLLEARAGEPVPVIRAEKTQLDEIFAGSAQVLGRANTAIEKLNVLLTDDNIASISRSIGNLEVITSKLAADDGLVTQASTTLKDVSAASKRFETASASLGEFGDTANSQIGELGGDVDTLLAEFNKVVASANAVIDQSGQTLSATKAVIEGPATGAVEDTRLAAQDLRILINRLDRLTRDLEQNPQGVLVGQPIPYEDKRK
ncbi:MAG TPA: MlaD family protein [Hyphomonas sp.]|nr:MCE family protein [Hyphomonas sp.]MCB9970179.1 MCE family protein [Hyphomonas sp.]HPE49121.1 MlaD family protein [Hyphomonas sp.]